MSAFQAVNMALMPEPSNRHGEETAPTTPRPSTAPTPRPQRLDDSTTPTRANFGVITQRPLPESPFPAGITVPEPARVEKSQLNRGDSDRSNKSMESEDVDMDNSDDAEDGSDEESVNADGSRTTKKKKSQRFWCTDYPPCNLSFTRSEHLARHIRKHTGERPFQCHCSRRFSRLDNLRQHAQTVHVNEEIPQDSLAATGTRFQRQVRTDRVRPPGPRSRASTAGSTGSGGRGHTRNSLSASSISSIGSNMSSGPDIRRRPPPLVMAQNPAARLSVETYPHDHFQNYRPQSPSNFSTPTSATFSTNGQNSPRWGSGMHSPITAHSRTASLYADHRTPGRRLSVPSGANPFMSPHVASYGQAPMTPLTANQGGFPSNGSVLASPTMSSSGSIWSRRDSVSNENEAWRRRTWHPETYSNFTSRLINVTTPGQYEESQQQQAPGNQHPAQTTRLPGIESFDPLRRPLTPENRGPSPMMIDTPSSSRGLPPTSADQYDRANDRRNMPQWDMGLHRNLNKLEIAQGTPPSDTAGAWASEANRAVQAQAEQVRGPQPTVRFEEHPYPIQTSGFSKPPFVPGHHHTISAPPLTPRTAKRQGWYNGPISYGPDPRRQRTSPAESSSSEGVPGTPSSASIAEYHPSIMHSSGWVEPQSHVRDAPPAPHQQADRYSGTFGPQGGLNSSSNPTYSYDPTMRTMAPSLGPRQEPKPDMLRLEALVAVATSEDNATTAY